MEIGLKWRFLRCLRPRMVPPIARSDPFYWLRDETHENAATLSEK